MSGTRAGGPSQRESTSQWRRTGRPCCDVTTTTLSGHIVSLTNDTVVILPGPDRTHLIEIRKASVLDFSVCTHTGRCNFIVPASALIEELVTECTTTRRQLRAGDAPSL